MHTEKWVSAKVRAKEKDTTESTIWRHSAKGLEPPLIKLSPGMSRFVRSELDAVDAARIAGANDDAIRTLVRQLVADRKQQVAA